MQWTLKRMLLRRTLPLALACTIATLPAAAQDAAAVPMADSLVDNFRRILLLHETHPGHAPRAQAEAGRYLFYQNRLLAGRLVAVLANDDEQCLAVLAHIESGAPWRDADRLALGGVLGELALRVAPGSTCAPAVQRARESLALVRARYNNELSTALGGRTGTSGVASRASDRTEWQSYIAFLRIQLAGQTLAPDLGAPAAPLAPGIEPLARQGARDEWTDGGLPPRALLLTFDDGPHPVYTPRILDILARYRIKAVFFQVGLNIARLSAATAKETTVAAAAGVAAEPVGANAATARGAGIPDPQIITRILAEGHAIANHTHTHPLLPHLDELKVTAEIDQTEALLSAAAHGHPGRAPLFRPPYGARNDLVLAEVTARGLRSVLWNIDSRDWADPVSQSVARRVIDEAVREGSGIVLFHDIHARAPDALPTVIEELQKRGFRFARYADGKLLVDP